MSDRNLIKRESGHIVYDAAGTPATFFAEASISLTMSEETVALPSLLFGELDKIPVGRLVKVKFIPQEFSTGAVTALFPHGALALGASIFGATDKTLDIHTTTGKRVRIPCAAVYKEPEIRGDIKKTPFGEVEFWGIVGIGDTPDSLDAFINETSVSYPGASGFDKTKVITPAWVVTWGASPFDSIDLAESGFSIKTTSKLTEDKVMGMGLTNVVLTDYMVQTTFEPMNITRAAIMARMGMATALGGRKSAAAADFIATGTGIYVAAYNQHISECDPFEFDLEKRTSGKITLESTRTVTSGTASSKLFIGDEAPA